MIPFSPPRIDQKIIDEVTDTLKSGWITTGPKTKLFEKKLTAYCGHKSTLCVSSATAGLELILRWFGVGEGDEVILPAYTYSATANVIVHCGATPVFADVNSTDFNINVAEIERLITKKTKVIMPVDFAGLPCDYQEINELVRAVDIKKYFCPKTTIQKQLGRILILSDAAHSLGAEYYGMKTGSLTDISVFSFHAVKNLTTAEGGAIALNLPPPFDNLEIYKYLNMFSLHGQSKDALAKSQAGNWRYDIVEAGYKANMTDISASFGLVELARYEQDTLIKRQAIFEQYTNAFSGNSLFQVPIYQTEAKKSSWHVYALRINSISETQRDAIISKIFEQQVSVNVHFIPLPMLSFYRKLGYEILDYPTTYNNFSQEISLPVYYNLSHSGIEKVIVAVKNAVKEVVG